MIHINEKSRIPKYKQILRSVKNNIKTGNYKQGDKLPSINSLRQGLPVSRDTIIKAYKDLASMGIINSVPGKGYYVSKTSSEIKNHVFLLFDIFLPYKKIIYNSFLDKIGKDAMVDLFFHHYNLELYKKLIKESLGQYTDFVIMPIEGGDELLEWFDNNFTEESVYILDVGINQYGRKYPSVCQNFNKQLYEGLSKGVRHIKKYDQLIFKYPSSLSKYTEGREKEMVAGCEKFCIDNKIDFMIINDIESFEVKEKQCFYVPNDRDLVCLVQKARTKNLCLCEDIGIISHNETPLKSIICMNGVATITSDFVTMGEKMAEMVINSNEGHIECPTSLIYRKSF